MKLIYLSLGSNVGDREEYLRRALDELNSPELRIRRISPVYETEPQGFANQKWFLNLVAEADTSLLPLQLLNRCHKVERTLGRRRAIRNGPRTIDIDIVLFANAVVHTGELAIPHPRYRERRFVLQPLADLAPDLRDPATRATVREMLSALQGQVSRRTDLRICAPVEGPAGTPP